MGSVEYLRVLERLSGFAARLYVLETEQAVVCYPFLIRPTDMLPFAVKSTSGMWDTYTPEYTGPLFGRFGNDRVIDHVDFPGVFADYCRQNGIVAEFAHLNPWFATEALLDPDCVVENREVVYVDLAAGETGVWTGSLNSDARRQTRQAGKAGASVRFAETVDDVLEFYRLHVGTMDRLEALERYRIPADYFVDIFETMPTNAFFSLAEYQGRVIAGGLYLHGGSDVYWHLSAVDREYSSVRPVNKYLWETIVWATGAGKRRMLLGGGYRGNDGVFRFKAGYSPLRATFSTYRRVHDRQAFNALNNAWTEYYGKDSAQSNYFPAYRSIPESLDPG
jgi:hypothetical protein